jgi:uncharacterized protein YicC (UPF0701 family)
MFQKHLEKIVIGAAIAMAASVLLPVVKTTLRSLAQSGKNEGIDLVEKMKGAVQTIKEEVEDIIAEAQFERMVQKIDKEIEKEGM